MQVVAGNSHDWTIDNRINLTAICERENWHLWSVIKALMAKEIDRADAAAFADFVFADKAIVSDDEPEDWVTDAQYERLGSV